jgi:thiamine kinase-like enzyme
MNKSNFILISLLIVAGLIIAFALYRSDKSKIAIKLISEKLQEPAPFNLKQLKGGISGAQIFLVSNENKKFIVRFLPKNSPYQANNELECLNVASKAGYGPTLYYSDTKQGVAIMEFLENKDMPNTESEKFYISLAKFLHKIHRGPKFPTTCNIFEKINKNIDLVKSVKSSSAIPLNEIQVALDLIYSVLKPYLTETPCHFDLSPANIFIQGENIKAIDFETAANGDPFYDVARIVMSYCPKKAQEQAFLKLYLEHEPTEKEKAKLYLMKEVVYIDGALELLSMNLKNLHYYPKASEEQYQTFIEKATKGYADGTLDTNSPNFQIDAAKVGINYMLPHFKTDEFNNTINALKK